MNRMIYKTNDVYCTTVNAGDTDKLTSDIVMCSAMAHVEPGWTDCYLRDSNGALLDKMSSRDAGVVDWGDNGSDPIFSGKYAKYNQPN